MMHHEEFTHVPDHHNPLQCCQQPFFVQVCSLPGSLPWFFALFKERGGLNLACTGSVRNRVSFKEPVTPDLCSASFMLYCDLEVG